MRRVFHLAALVAILLSSAVLGVSAQEATPAGGASLLAELGYPELRVTTDGTTNDLPSEIEAGRYHVILENTSDVDVDLEFLQLPDGVTADDYATGLEEASAAEEFVLPDFFFDIVFNGGPTSTAGGTGEVILDLVPGEWVANVYFSDPETEAETNSPQMLTVTGEMPAVEEIAGAQDIVMDEMFFELPETIASGPQIWKVVNEGEQIHHVVLFGVPDGTTEEQVLELIAAFSAPPASPEAGATPVALALSFEDVMDVFETTVISGGLANWYGVDVAPGTYAMVCFLPDPSGTPHVMLGMIEIYTVE